jgi:hypothetical protein
MQPFPQEAAPVSAKAESAGHMPDHSPDDRQKFTVSETSFPVKKENPPFEGGFSQF